MVRLDEIFDIKHSKSLELINCEKDENGIPFISRTSSNNGMVARVKKMENQLPMPPNAITVALGGSVLSCFYQEESFYTAFHIACLYPKEKLSKIQMICYAYIIEKNKYRYNYGRQANRSLKNILVPSPNEIPIDFKNQSLQSNLTDVSHSPKKLSLNERKWEWFLLSDLFKVSRGTRLTKPDREKGNIPFITAGKENEGVACYISNKEMTRYNNAITIDMFGFSCFRNYEFCCDDNILVLKNEKISQFAKIFISTLINNDSYKCAYGRQYRQKTLAKHQIKLPITKTPTGATCPDWQFMEDYIKSLPYSGCL